MIHRTALLFGAALMLFGCTTTEFESWEGRNSVVEHFTATGLLHRRERERVRLWKLCQWFRHLHDRSDYPPSFDLRRYQVSIVTRYA